MFGLIRILLVANIALIDVENISKYGEKKDYLLIASSAFLHYHTFLICTKDNWYAGFINSYHLGIAKLD